MSLDMSLYTLADNVEAEVKYHGGNILLCDFVRRLSVEGTEIEVPMKLVSAYVMGEDVLAWFRSLGNLSLLFAAFRDGFVACYVVDMARMTMRPNNYLEVLRPRSVDDVKAVLRSAIVRSYRKVDGKWEQL